MRSVPLAVLFITSLFPCITAAADTYAVRQFHPWHAGDAFDLEVTATQHRHAEAGPDGRPPRVTDDYRAVHLAGRCTVRAVDDRGAYTAVDCRVATLTTSAARPEPDLLPAGTVVRATRGETGPTAFQRADGRPVPGDVERSLSLVLTACRPSGPTPDELFPAGRPRAVGESWAVDPARERDALRVAGLPPPDHVAGHATLVGPDTLAGHPAARVSHVLEADGPAPPPATAAGVRSAHRFNLNLSTATLPVDPADPSADLVDQDTVDYDLHGATPAGSAWHQLTHVVTDTHLKRSAATRP